GRRARHLPLPLRRRAGARRLPPSGALLPPLVSALRTLCAAPAAQGRGAPVRARSPAPPPGRRPPRPMAAGTRARRAPLPPAPAVGLHRARPPPTPHGPPRRPVAQALRALRPDRRPQRERPGV